MPPLSRHQAAACVSLLPSPAPTTQPLPTRTLRLFFTCDRASSSGMTVPARNSPRRVSAYAGEETAACTLQYRDVDPMTHHQEENLRLCTKKKNLPRLPLSEPAGAALAFHHKRYQMCFRPRLSRVLHLPSQTCPILSLPNPLLCLVSSNAGGSQAIATVRSGALADGLLVPRTEVTQGSPGSIAKVAQTLWLEPSTSTPAYPDFRTCFARAYTAFCNHPKS